MSDRNERPSDVLPPSDVLADAHAQDGEIDGDELGGGLGNTADGGANDG